jgi:Pro-Pro endopeptidase
MLQDIGMYNQMRKYLIAILVLSAIILGGLSKSSIDGILLINSPLYSTLDLRSGKYLGDIIVLPKQSNYDKNEVKKIISRLDKLPLSMLTKIDDKGIKVKLFTGKLTDNPTAAYLKGKTPRGYSNHTVTWDDVPGIGGSKTVLIKIGCSDKGRGHGSVNLELHELAHSLDHYLYNKNDDRNAFLQIWKVEAPQLFPNDSYFINYEEEFFAECFAMYYDTKDTRMHLKKLAPMTFQYISKLS